MTVNVTDDNGNAVAATAPEWRWYGSADPQVVAGGMSHRASLISALNKGLTPVRGAVLSAPANQPDDEYWAIVERLAPSVPIAFQYRGNESNGMFMFGPLLPFTVVRQSNPATGELIVPVEMVRALFAEPAAELAAMLDRFAGRRCVLVEPPPPLPETRVRAGLETEITLVNHLAARGLRPEDARVTALPRRIALNAIARELYAEVAAKRGVGVLQPPAEAVAPDGSLLTEYAHDATHANGTYGALVWRDIAAHFQLGEVA